MIGSLGNLMFKLHVHIIFVVNIKFPLATYHTIVPSTEELCCLNISLGRHCITRRSPLDRVFLPYIVEVGVMEEISVRVTEWISAREKETWRLCHKWPLLRCFNNSV